MSIVAVDDNLLAVQRGNWQSLDADNGRKLFASIKESYNDPTIRKAIKAAMGE